MLSYWIYAILYATGGGITLGQANDPMVNSRHRNECALMVRACSRSRDHIPARCSILYVWFEEREANNLMSNFNIFYLNKMEEFWKIAMRAPKLNPPHKTSKVKAVWWRLSFCLSFFLCSFSRSNTPCNFDIRFSPFDIFSPSSSMCSFCRSITSSSPSIFTWSLTIRFLSCSSDSRTWSCTSVILNLW